jgi:lambda family phage portal protein
MKKIDFFSRTIAKTIGAFFPKTALNFLYHRQILANYTGARPDGSNSAWMPTNQSADSILARDRVRLLARARDLERNTGHISGAMNKICNNVVYTGIFPQSRLRKSDNKLNKELNNSIEDQFKLWSEHEDVNFYDIQELVLRHLWVDGEVLIHKYFDRDLYKQGLCPLNLEVLECDFIDSSHHGITENGNEIKSGIEYNSKGKPVAYYLHKEHPGDSLFSRFSGEVQRIPAENICHVFHKKRGSQGRGVSWLASIIIEMRDFSEYQSSERIGARLAAAFGAFIESPYPEHQVNHPLLNEEGTSIDDIPKYFEPGRIDVLPPGMKINVAQYNRPGTSYEPFTKTSLKSASAGTNLSYENFSNDYEGSSYSSARQAVLEERRGYRKMQFFLNRHFNNWVWKHWCNFAQISQLIPSNPRIIPVNWQNPGWAWIDPAKDAKGAQMELDMRITTRRRLAAERGLDWDEEIEEFEEELEIMKQKGINPDPANTEATDETVPDDQR